MTFENDFKDATGWSCADTNVRLNTVNGRKFVRFLTEQGVKTVIRYYASTQRPKTITSEEAKFLLEQGFAILPVYQDRNREPEDFGRANGETSGRNALKFAEMIGQPDGSTIMFAVDSDFKAPEVKSHIAPYFEGVRAVLGPRFRVGAYGSGLVLRTLIDKGLIDVPWISMSRLFQGTKDFFLSDDWAFRQVPPDKTHAESGVSYDRNVMRWTPAEIGAFGATSAEAPDGVDAVLGGGAAQPAAVAAVNAYVSTEGLNLRDKPDGTVIRELTIADPVEDRGPADVPGWRRVSVSGITGVVFGKYLRQPSSPEVEALVASAVREWVRFDKGRADERGDPYFKFVGEMWRSIGETYDGRSRYPNGEEVPWSAAFISFVVRRAGPAYANFKFAASHSVFVHDAIQSRILNRTNRPFWGYRRTEKKPEVGDIVQRNRQGGSFSFDFAENHSQYISHSDIVVEVTSSVARVLGGNVGDTISLREIASSGDDVQEYALDESGFIAPGQRVIAVLKNRAGQV